MSVFLSHKHFNAIRGVCGDEGLKRVASSWIKVGLLWVVYRNESFFGLGGGIVAFKLTIRCIG